MVFASGAVVAVGAGTARITARAGNYSASCTFTVTKRIPVSGITISKSISVFNAGSSTELSAYITPTNATNKAITWSSSNSTVASITSSGYNSVIVNGNSPGTATITAKSSDGNYRASCTVTVKPVPVSGVSIAMSSSSVNIGSSLSLSCTISPAGATNKSVTWSTSDSSVASIKNDSSNPVSITGIKAGTATITVKTKDGSYTDSCKITVTKPPVKVQSISLAAKASVQVGHNILLTPTIMPTDAANQKVTWSSSDKTIASVDNDGRVTGKKVSSTSVKITATTADGGKTATCLVTVTPVNVTSVELSETNITVTKGKTYSLTATVRPTDATNQKVNWSSDSSNATVDSNGLVTGVKASSATITVTTVDGKKTATCKVMVQEGSSNPYGDLNWCYFFHGSDA